MPDSWKMTVDGEVNNKIEITLGELKKKFKPVTRRMVLECGGNGRSFFTPQARGNQWTNGGAGCAEWTGVRLSDVLKAAGVKESAQFTGHYGSRQEPRRREQGRDLARRADQEGDGRQQPHRVRDERPAAAAHPWRAGAARGRRMAGLGVGQVVHAALGARQVSRRSRHGRDVLPRRDQADGAGRQGGRGQFPRSRIDAGALDHHQPGERHQAAGRHQGGAASRRRLGRRPSRAARRCVDRLRRHLDARGARARRRTSTTGSAGPRR